MSVMLFVTMSILKSVQLLSLIIRLSMKHLTCKKNCFFFRDILPKIWLLLFLLYFPTPSPRLPASALILPASFCPSSSYERSGPPPEGSLVWSPPN